MMDSRFLLKVIETENLKNNYSVILAITKKIWRIGRPKLLEKL